MEFVDGNLRQKIQNDDRVSDPKIQLKIAKQIASAMNFFSSLNPPILVHFIFGKDLKLFSQKA